MNDSFLSAIENILDYDDVQERSITEIFECLKIIKSMNLASYDASSDENLIYDCLDDLNEICRVASQKLDIEESSKELSANQQNEYRILLLEARSGVEYLIVNSRYNILKNYIEKQEEGFKRHIEKRAKKTAKKIEQDINKNAYTRLFSLMGVFTTIITVILSLVVTTSSWLNNANGCQALIAFVVPSAIVVVAITILLGIVLPENNVAVTGRLIATGIICVLLVVSVGLSFNYELSSHTQYIITPNEYRIIEDEDTNKTVIEFTVANRDVRNTYSKSLFHEHKNLYYCVRHEKLE